MLSEINRAKKEIKCMGFFDGSVINSLPANEVETRGLISDLGEDQTCRGGN